MVSNDEMLTTIRGIADWGCFCEEENKNNPYSDKCLPCLCKSEYNRIRADLKSTYNMVIEIKKLSERE